MKHTTITVMSAFVFMMVATMTASAEKPVELYPAAILPFAERGREVSEQGRQVSDLLFAFLSTDETLFLVDRESLQSSIDEQELSLSGVVKTDEAVQVGQLTGAKILVTGSVMQVGSSRFLIAKIMGTETTRVVGASVKGTDDEDLDILVEQLASKISESIGQNAENLVAKPVSREDMIAELRKTMKDAKRPTVSVQIPENHIGDRTIDPAAETELTQFAIETGFTVLDGQSKKDPDIVIRGEAFSEFAGRRGNLISVKARVEIKAIQRSTGRILVADRQTVVAVDLSEQIAAKKALQTAGAELAQRVLPKLVSEVK